MKNKEKVISAVQGADDDWPDQMAWTFYYILGALCFMSIMTRTVNELILSVKISSAVARVELYC